MHDIPAIKHTQYTAIHMNFFFFLLVLTVLKVGSLKICFASSDPLYIGDQSKSSSPKGSI